MTWLVIRNLENNVLAGLTARLCKAVQRPSRSQLSMNEGEFTQALIFVQVMVLKGIDHLVIRTLE